MTTNEPPSDRDRSPAARRHRLSPRGSVPLAALLIGVCVVAVGVVGDAVLNALTPSGTPGHTTTTIRESCSNPPNGARCPTSSAFGPAPAPGRAV